MSRSDYEPPPPDRRPPPASTMQVAGQAASDVIGGLKQQPLMLAIVVLNLIGIGAAVWFVNNLEERQHARSVELFKMLRDCATPHRSGIDDPFLFRVEGPERGL
jgi:hypothetical protein